MIGRGKNTDAEPEATEAPELAGAAAESWEPPPVEIAAEPVAPPPPGPYVYEPVTGDSAAQSQSRPEVAIGAAFAGGLLSAMLLRRLGR